MKIEFSIYRYNPDVDSTPYMKLYYLNISKNNNVMLLDVLKQIKEKDPTLSFRHSCREGVCGSDGININGKNGLACITPLSSFKKNKKITIRPLPGLPIIRDLIIDMNQFYTQYKKVQPYLINNATKFFSNQENLQTPKQRKKLDGLYECILCACCSTACPSFWWNPDKFIGPAGLLTSYRFLVDNRDTDKNNRLKNLNDTFQVFRCHSIMNCIKFCPKNLNPTETIKKIKLMLLKHNL